MSNGRPLVYAELIQHGRTTYILEWYVEPPVPGAVFVITEEDWVTAAGTPVTQWWSIPPDEILIRRIYDFEPRLVTVSDVIAPDGTVRRGP